MMDIPSLSTIQSSTSVNALYPAWLSSTSCESSCESTNYINDSQTVKAFEVLQSLREDEYLGDVKLKADDDQFFTCHKGVLMSGSQYFQAMFTNFSEHEKDIIDIRQIDSTVLKKLVNYIYTGKIMISKENVQDLLPAANLLQLDWVKRACAKFLQKRLDPFNCIGFRSFANFYNCLELLAFSDEYIRKKFSDVVKGEEFLSLSTEELIKFISGNVLNASEEEVYECVINWVKYELNVRYDSLPKLMENVRLPLVSLEYISSIVVEEPLFKNLPKSKDYLTEAFQFHALKRRQQRFPTIPQTIQNTPRMSGQKVFLVFSNSVCNNHWYNPTTNMWGDLPVYLNIKSYNDFDRSAFIKKHFVVSMENSLLKIYGFSSEPTTVTYFSTYVSRKNFGFGIFDHYLYAVGGCGKDGYLNCAEAFDMNNYERRMIANMSTKRSNLGVGVLNGLLYAVGGSNNDSMQLKSVECYDPSLDTWIPVADMRACRSDIGVGVMDGVLYAVGGKYGDRCLSSVEAYKPSTGVWTSIANMHIARSGSSVVALDGLLYVIGGYDGKSVNTYPNVNPDVVRNSVKMSNVLNSVEIYDPDTNTWSIEYMNWRMYAIFGVLIVDKTLVIRGPELPYHLQGPARPAINL